jgi:DNA-binding LacI/PurR family transcriptional regulator
MAAPGGVTVKQIAVAAGLSQPAVSQVLNNTGRISEATRQRVLKVAEKMGYRPNAAARAVVTKRTRQVGVLVLNNPSEPETQPYSYYTILGLNMALEQAGYVLCLVRLGDVMQGPEGASRVFREHVLDGMVVLTQLSSSVAKRVADLVPVTVWADTQRWAKHNCLRRDEYDVGRACAEHAISAGYRRVVFVSEAETSGTLPMHFSFVDRRRGIEETCNAAGIAHSVIEHRWGWSPGFDRMLAPFLQPDTAVIASDPFRARMVQHSAMARRLIIGEDFGMACCDIVHDMQISWPELAGMPYDRLEFGRQAARMILAMLEMVAANKPSEFYHSRWRHGSTLGPLGRTTPPSPVVPPDKPASVGPTTDIPGDRAGHV